MNKVSFRIRECEGCGEQFLVYPTSGGHYSRKTCSDACMVKVRVRKNQFPPERRKALSEANKARRDYKNLHTPKARAKASVSMARTKLGTPNVNNRGKAYNHLLLKDPDGVIHELTNISQFVRDNPHLFNKDDLVPKPNNPSKPESASTYCRAENGLRSISCCGPTTKGQWKGWTLVARNGYHILPI